MARQGGLGADGVENVLGLEEMVVEEGRLVRVDAVLRAEEMVGGAEEMMGGAEVEPVTAAPGFGEQEASLDEALRLVLMRVNAPQHPVATPKCEEIPRDEDLQFVTAALRVNLWTRDLVNCIEPGSPWYNFYVAAAGFLDIFVVYQEYFMDRLLGEFLGRMADVAGVRNASRLSWYGKGTFVKTAMVFRLGKIIASKADKVKAVQKIYSLGMEIADIIFESNADLVSRMKKTLEKTRAPEFQGYLTAGSASNLWKVGKKNGKPINISDVWETKMNELLEVIKQLE